MVYTIKVDLKYKKYTRNTGPSGKTSWLIMNPFDTKVVVNLDVIK